MSIDGERRALLSCCWILQKWSLFSEPANDKNKLASWFSTSHFYIYILYDMHYYSELSLCLNYMKSLDIFSDGQRLEAGCVP